MYLRKVLSSRRGPWNWNCVGLPGEKIREGHVTVALDVCSELNLCTGSICKNCV